MLLMLEDDAERITRFRAILAEIAPTLPLRIWRDAHVMIAEMDTLLPFTTLISLDHDLEPEMSTSTDPGTGWDLAQVLAERPPICPIILHTSNSDRATWMTGAFDMGGWKVYRVPPLGDDWIEFDWRRLVRRILRRRRP